MNEENKVNRAQEFARTAHQHIGGVSVSGVKKPQIHHIQEVADLVWISGGNDDEITAAWLHDSVEDTDTALADIERHFGKHVAEIVEGLTDLDHFKGLPPQERKKLQAERVRHESESVRRVKLADQLSNVRALTIDPIKTMPEHEMWPYIQGAKFIADECRGISSLLDDLFDKFFALAEKKYKNVT
jgi:(p)ppGpp synthase/HD superfamily hydrolase